VEINRKWMLVCLSWIEILEGTETFEVQIKIFSKNLLF
jgi:hypothetical protein